MYGIKYKEKHSYNDFGLTVAAKSISPPTKKKIKSTIPYMQGSYDFSNLYGEQTYEERKLNYTFNLIAKSKLELNIKKIQILDWLMNSYKTKLEDDVILGYYFLAECENVNFKENGDEAEIEASFVAYPFKISSYEEGRSLWDTFNFELDYMQDTEFIVRESKNINLYNNSVRKITPTVVCSSDFNVVKDNTTYNFKAGETREWKFNLNIGLNELVLNGTGSIKFIFRKEVF